MKKLISLGFLLFVGILCYSQNNRNYDPRPVFRGVAGEVNENSRRAMENWKKNHPNVPAPNRKVVFTPQDGLFIGQAIIIPEETIAGVIVEGVYKKVVAPRIDVPVGNYPYDIPSRNPRVQKVNTVSGILYRVLKGTTVYSP